MLIKKTSQYIEGGASLSNEYGTSDSNGYTQEYINSMTIPDSSWTSAGANGFDMIYKKVGNVVTVFAKSQENITIDGYTARTVGYLPEGIRPSTNYIRSGVYSKGTSNIYSQIQSNGNVIIFNWGSALTLSDAGQVAFTITYIV